MLNPQESPVAGRLSVSRGWLLIYCTHSFRRTICLPQPTVIHQNFLAVAETTRHYEALAGKLNRPVELLSEGQANVQQ